MPIAFKYGHIDRRGKVKQSQSLRSNLIPAVLLLTTIRDSLNQSIILRQFTELPHKKTYITEIPHIKFFITDLPHIRT